MDINEFINSTNILKGLGYLFFLAILMLIAYLNGYHMKNRNSLFIFALITCLIFTLLPYGVNRDCEGAYTEYFCLGYIDDNLDEYEQAEKLGISLQRNFANMLITIIFFGFAANAIATNIVGRTAFSGSSSSSSSSSSSGRYGSSSRPGSSSRYGSSGTPGSGLYRGGSTGENLKNLSVAITSPFSTMVYMAIFIIMINVFSNIYIYFNCEDKQTDYNIRSFILGQYNIILITIVGLIMLGVSRSQNL